MKAKIGWLTLFSVAMGYLECAVVVYLREIYYPSGFGFPVTPASGVIGLTETLRETATIFMLLSVGFLAGKDFRQRFAAFIYCFAVWDLCYYVFLRILIHWPESWFTWDLLFLIPMVWTGPVIAPMVVSVTMILLAFIMFFQGAPDPWPNRWLTRTLILSGAFLIVISFIWDFSRQMLQQYPLTGLFNSDNMIMTLQGYIPARFNWWIFIAGEAVLFSGIYLIYAGSRKSTKKYKPAL